MKPQTATERLLLRETRALLRPPPRLTVSQWADAFRMLSAEASAEPGRWMTDRAPYQGGIMDAVSDPDTEEVVVMSSAQVGKTEIVNNVLGFHVAQDPAPVLVVQPTLEMAEAWSKDRLAPMLRDTPALQGKVKDARSRDSGNTLLHKSYPGGQITIAGANSAASLASRPKRIILFDEVDRYPASAGTEGDPVSLGRKRAATFHNRKLVLVSTPTIKGVSRIERAYAGSDQRVYMVPCPHCKHEQRLLWKGVQWPDGEPDKAAYVCESCGALIEDKHKLAMLRRGRWVATKPFKGIAGFHVSELYSPWRKFSQIAADFLAAKGSRDLLQVWTNTSLGETWEDQEGEQLAWEKLLARAEPYTPLTVPLGGLVLTAGVDVQDTRLAVVVRAWGRGEESWLVYHGEIYGDPAQDQVWADLDDLLGRPFAHASGTDMHITAAAVDSGGHHTQRVYVYARDRGPRVIAIKGSNVEGSPIRGKPSDVDVNHMGQKIPKGVRLWHVGVSTAKGLIYGRLKMTGSGPGRYHWPIGMDEEYFKQLTAERRTTKLTKGQAVLQWVRVRDRNEALDCEVYAYAAAIHAGVQRVDWDKLERRVTGDFVSPATIPDDTVPDSPLPMPKAATPKHRRRPGNFATGWR